MASPSTIPDSRHKSKLPQYGARQAGQGQMNRDKPLFTAMRRPQFQQDFTTESLNNTAIGSPSPARSLHYASNGPDRLGRGVGLSAGFRRFEERSKNGENQEKSQSNVKRDNKIIARPVYTRQYQSEAAKPSPRIIPPTQRTRTPSPARGRSTDVLLSPMSEVSESSPPREFAEAYKQINDEEDLAAQEDELEETEDMGDVLDEDDSVQPIQDSSRRSSRRRTPGVDDAIILDSPNKLQPQITQDSTSSLPSDLELEAASSLRHKQDLQRLDLALGETKAFSKANRRSRLPDADVQHDIASPRSGSHSEHSNTSGSILSDGSLNIPQTWGRKAKKGKSWLSRLDRDGSNAEKGNLSKIKDLEGSVARSRAVEDWQEEASMTPLPPVAEQDSLEHSPSPAPARLTALSARERVRKLAFGEDKFSAAQNEDANLRTRNTALDLIREREIQDLTRSAVTTNRLGELKEKRSLERVGNRSTSFGSDHEQTNVIKQEIENAWKPRPAQTILQSVSEEVRPVGNMSKSDGKRVFIVDSKLGQDVQDPFKLEDQTTPNSNIPGSRDDHRRPEYGVFDLPDLHTPAQAKSVKSQVYLKTPLVTGAWVDTPLPAEKVGSAENLMKAEEIKDVLHQTSAEHGSQDSKTDTQRSTNTQMQQQSLQKTAPKLPGSALAAIIARAKDKKSQGGHTQGEDTLLLDDSTILSLEEFIASGEDSDPSSSDEATTNKILPKKLTKRYKSRTSRSIEQDSASEGEVGLTTRLDRLRSSMQDAKVGIGSLQKRISKLPHRSSSASSSRAPSTSRLQSECEEAGEFHDFIWPCEKCGHKSGSVAWSADNGPLLEWHWRPLQVYMPKLWVWPTDARFPTMTRLGWGTALCIILAVTEMILHEMYSPPFYASTMVGYGVNINTPRPPFVLAKLIWLHVLSSPLSAIQILLRIFVRFVTSILGVSAGAFAPIGDATYANTADMKWSYRPGVIPGSQADTMGMDADELL